MFEDPRLLPKEDNSTKATSCQVSYSGDDKSRLAQFFQRRLVFGDNVLLRSELGAFGVHHGFGGAAHELLYFRYAQVPNAGLGHIHASMAATLALRICRSRATSALSMPLHFWQ